VIGEIFYSQNYGIATQKQLSGIAKNLSETLLVFRENGFLDYLESKYIPYVCAVGPQLPA
jgi:hypothetical protein